MKQMEEQEKILNKLKQKAGKGNVDDFLKILLWIRYAFPSYTDESL